MSILNVLFEWDGSGASKSVDGTEVNNGSVAKYTVLFDDRDAPADRPLMAVDDSRIPQPRDAHPFDPWMFVTDVRAIGLSPILFEVVVTYTQVPDPLSEPPKLTWTFSASNEPIDRDINDVAITNSSDESYDPPITKDFYDAVLTVERNEAGPAAGLSQNFLGAVNNNSFYGISPGLAKGAGYDAQPAQAGGFEFYVVRYEFQVRWDGWGRRVLDEGFREKTGTDANSKPTYTIMKDVDGNPLSQPVLLNGSGAKLDDGAAAVFLLFDLHPFINFPVF